MLTNHGKNSLDVTYQIFGTVGFMPGPAIGFTHD